MSDTDDIIRAAIRKEMARRAEAGDSQAAIARAAGIHPVTLSNYMRGAKDIYVDSLIKLLAELDLHVVPRGRRRGSSRDDT